MLRGVPLRLLLLLAACLAPSCRGDAPSPGAKRYPIKGRIVEVDTASRSVTLAHEDIPGFMPAMTMPFVVLEKDAALLQQMAPGDSLQAVLVVKDSRYWLEELVLVKAAVPLSGQVQAAPPRQPQPGDAVPDVALVDQDGRALHLADYHGRALALTFVFTRCPMPDFCPFLMAGFARVHEALVAEPRLARETALLTVSFDVQHDTPAVLRGYGLPFQKTKPPFSHWRLASGRLDEVRRLGAALGLDFREEDRSFTHNLRTAVIGKDGRLRRLLRGNDWKPEELLAELEAAAGS
ncbi:MAG TPA: SCO family protein [Vicinamibacteria bacterium]|nr:SCO family protein [Vicinamibacteria bacterium]